MSAMTLAGWMAALCLGCGASVFRVRLARQAELVADAGHELQPADRLLAAVKEAVDSGEDPELALRRAADEYRQQVEAQ